MYVLKGILCTSKYENKKLAPPHLSLRKQIANISAKLDFEQKYISSYMYEYNLVYLLR